MKFLQLRYIAAMALSAAMGPATARATAPEASPRIAVIALRDASVPVDVTNGARDKVAATIPGTLGAADLARAYSQADEIARRDALAKAAARAAKGRSLYQSLDFDKAIPELEAARDAMIGALASQEDGALVDVLLDLGSVRADFNQGGPAREAFRQARSYGAPAELPATRPQKIRELYREATAGMRADCGLDVSSTPGTKVFVDGRPLGVAPVMVRGLVEGPHLVRVSLAGWRPAIVAVRSEAGAIAPLRLAPGSATADDPAKGIDAANKSPDDLFRSGAVLGSALGVDDLVLTGFVRPSPGAPPTLRTIVIDVPRAVSLGMTDFTGADAATKAATDAAAKISAHPRPAPTPGISIE